MMDDIIMTKMSPMNFAVLNPLTVFTAFTEMTKIHTINLITTIAIRSKYPKTGPIKERLFFICIWCHDV